MSGQGIKRSSETGGVGGVLALGFATAVGVWAVAYLCRVPMIGPVAGAETVTLMLLAVLAGGVAAGRFTGRGVAAGLAVGLITGLLEILILLSILRDILNRHPEYKEAQTLVLWIAGSILCNVIVAGAGSVLGACWRGRSAVRALCEPAWAALFAWTLAVATLFLIGAGGLVTAWGVGMAVPDWPTSFGYNMFLFPLSQMQEVSGRFYEHAHRLLGTLVGLTSLTLAVYVSCTEKRRGIITLAWVIFAAVCFQGYLGGIRVNYNSKPLAIVHGVFAQMLFSGMVGLAIATSRTWRGFVPAAVEKVEALRSGHSDDVLTVLVVAATVLQLVLGAMLRHLNWQVLFHITNAVFVTLLALGAGIRAWGLNPQARPLQRAGVTLMLVLLGQLIVGVVALAVRKPMADDPTGVHAVVTTAHQVLGAVLLAAGLGLAMWTRRDGVASSSASWRR